MLDPERLAKTIEPALEPELPIIDPHNHLWDMDPESWGRYLADVTAGHRVSGTVFVDCQTMYRASSPEALRPVGETEFVESVAARFAMGSRPWSSSQDRRFGDDWTSWQAWSWWRFLLGVMTPSVPHGG